MMFPNVPVVANPRDEWYTPAWIIECARVAFGGDIDLDPASCAMANETVRAKRYITPPDDGLLAEWTGNVWINPPFSAGKTAKFVDKAFESECRFIMLTMAIGASKWFFKLWDAALNMIILNRNTIRFGRPVKLGGSEGQPGSGKLPFLISLFSNLPSADFERGFGHISRVR